MGGSKLPSKISNGDVRKFLDKVAAAPIRTKIGEKGRLIFGLDATASRQPAWDRACHLQGEMFQETAALGGLFAIAENYPDLKANENFMQLQKRISHLEESLADRREFYNDSTNNYNIRIKQIPDVFVAGMLSYRDEELFKVSEKERQDVDIKIKLPKFG